MKIGRILKITALAKERCLLFCVETELSKNVLQGSRKLLVKGVLYILHPEWHLAGEFIY